MQDRVIPKKYKELSEELEKLQQMIKKTPSRDALGEESKEELSVARENIVKATVKAVQEDANKPAEKIKASYLVSLDKVRLARKAADKAVKLVLKKNINSNT